MGYQRRAILIYLLIILEPLQIEHQIVDSLLAEPKKDEYCQDKN